MVVTLMEVTDIFQAVSLLLALSRPLRKSKLTENLLNSLASDVSGIPLEKIPQGKGSVWPI